MWLARSLSPVRPRLSQPPLPHKLAGGFFFIPLLQRFPQRNRSSIDQRGRLKGRTTVGHGLRTRDSGRALSKVIQRHPTFSVSRGDILLRGRQREHGGAESPEQGDGDLELFLGGTPRSPICKGCRWHSGPHQTELEKQDAGFSQGSRNDGAEESEERGLQELITKEKNY